jgi:hypothetical protein
VAAVAVSDVDITRALKAGETETLRQWGREGVRVASAEPLLTAAHFGRPDVVRLLVEKLGASINQAGAHGIVLPQRRCVVLVRGAWR